MSSTIISGLTEITWAPTPRRSSGTTCRRRGATRSTSAGPRCAAFFIENALYWLHGISLRRAAVRRRPRHRRHRILLHELAARCAPRRARRHVHLVLENEGNDAQPAARGELRRAMGRRCHHCLHVLLTGEHEGYYEDYADAPAGQLARCLAEGFAYQGELSRHHDGEPRGSRARICRPPPSSSACRTTTRSATAPWRTADGPRPSRGAAGGHRAAAAVPQIPLLFMGEE